MFTHIRYVFYNFILGFFVLGCGGIGTAIQGLPQPSLEPSLKVTPEVSIVSEGDTINFVAFGGTPPYSFSTDSSASEMSSFGGYRAEQVGLELITVVDAKGVKSHATVFVQPRMVVSPQGGVVMVGESLAFNVFGGVPPYVATIVEGQGTVSFTSALEMSYVAPSASQSVRVQVTDSLGADINLNIEVNGSLSVEPEVVASLVIGDPLSFSVEGGVPPYIFSTISGAGSISAESGVYAGYAPGVVNLKVTDSVGHVREMTVTNQVATLQMMPATLTVALGNVYLFTARGGFPPYTYSVVNGGGSIDSSSGLFMAPMTLGTVTIQVTDSQLVTASANVTVNPSLSVSPSTYDLAINQSVTLIPQGGVPPYSFSVTLGGGSIDAGGVYTASSSPGSVVVSVNDASGNLALSSLTIKPAVSISPKTVVTAPNGSIIFVGSGGVPPYTFSVNNGSGVIDPITGEYEASANPGDEEVLITDSRGASDVAQITIDNVLNISSSHEMLAVGNTMTFSASGGTAPYAFSIVDGVGRIDASGFYEAVVEGSATIQVQDAMGTKKAKIITIHTALSATMERTFLVRNEEIQVTGVNGVPPYQYSLVSGRGSIDSVTGLFSSSKYFVGTDKIKVTDAIGNVASIEAKTTVPISNGLYTSCAIHPRDLDLYCFGYNGTGAVGIGNTLTWGDHPSEIGSGAVKVNFGVNRKVLAVSGGGYFFCAILDNHSVKCWGHNLYGRLGEGNQTDRGTLPSHLGDAWPVVDLGAGRTALGITTGYASACALLDDQSVKCWGYNGYGELGAGSTATLGDGPNEMGDNLNPINLGTGRTTLMTASGWHHNCALLDDQTVKCWGYNGYGQLGIGDAVSRGTVASQMGDNLLTVNLGVGRKAKYISAGHYHSCAILDDDTAKCWGYNGNGELGIGSMATIGDSPTELGDAMKAVDLGTGVYPISIGSGYHYSCFLLNTKDTKCFGYNLGGQLGIGTTSPQGHTMGTIGDNAAAAKHGADLKVLAIGNSTGVEASGIYRVSSCFLYDNLKYKCMGFNGYGELGIGTTTNMGWSSSTVGDNIPFFGIPYGY